MHDAMGGGTRGFSLLEALVAIVLVGGAVASLAQLVAVATQANVRARATTVGSILALEKMEQLSAYGASLPVSPGDALQRNAAGYCDFFDGAGRSLGGGASPPPGAIYVRRWAVAALDADPENARVLQVRVVRGNDLIGPDSAASGSDTARLVAVKTRREP